MSAVHKFLVGYEGTDYDGVEFSYTDLVPVRGDIRVVKQDEGPGSYFYHKVLIQQIDGRYTVYVAEGSESVRGLRFYTLHTTLTKRELMIKFPLLAEEAGIMESLNDIPDNMTEWANGLGRTKSWYAKRLLTVICYGIPAEFALWLLEDVVWLEEAVELVRYMYDPMQAIRKLVWARIHTLEVMKKSSELKAFADTFKGGSK